MNYFVFVRNKFITITDHSSPLCRWRVGRFKTSKVRNLRKRISSRESNHMGNLCRWLHHLGLTLSQVMSWTSVFARPCTPLSQIILLRLPPPSIYSDVLTVVRSRAKSSLPIRRSSNFIVGYQILSIGIPLISSVTWAWDAFVRLGMGIWEPFTTRIRKYQSKVLRILAQGFAAGRLTWWHTTPPSAAEISQPTHVDDLHRVSDHLSAFEWCTDLDW